MIEIQDLLYQLRLSEQASTQLFEKKLGISLTRYQILLFLLKHSPCNQIAVQERLKIDQAALTRHFKILEKEGLVERHRNSENQREVLVEATKYAKEQLVVNPPLTHIKVCLLYTSSNPTSSFCINAGWSSSVARRAHNPKVVGSNPAPAIRLGSSVGRAMD